MAQTADHLATTSNLGDELPLKVMKGDEEANGPDTSNLLLRHQPFLTGTNAIPAADAIKEAGKNLRTHRFITWRAKLPAAIPQREWKREREQDLFGTAAAKSASGDGERQEVERDAVRVAIIPRHKSAGIMQGGWLVCH